MNAAGQRRLTPWLVVACVVLAALWCALLLGVGRDVRWSAPKVAHPLPMAHATSAVQAAPLGRYAVVWQRPLFTVGRRPLPEASDAGQHTASLDNLELTGVILAPHMHIALLRDRTDGHTVHVRKGAQLGGSGWVLDSLKPRSVVFVDHGKRTRLTLKKPVGGTGAATVPARVASTAPPPSRPPPATRTDTARQHARIQALKQRIAQRRRQQAASAGDQHP